MTEIRDHSEANREKLRRAGLSMRSELRPDQIERLETADVEMGERPLRDHILGGQSVMKEQGQSAQRGPTAGDKAVAMLRERGAMHYRDLAEKLVAEGLVTPRGKTFAQTLSAELSRRNGQDIERVAPGVYAAKPQVEKVDLGKDELEPGAIPAEMKEDEHA